MKQKLKTLAAEIDRELKEIALNGEKYPSEEITEKEQEKLDRDDERTDKPCWA